MPLQVLVAPLGSVEHTVQSSYRPGCTVSQSALVKQVPSSAGSLTIKFGYICLMVFTVVGLQQ